MQHVGWEAFSLHFLEVCLTLHLSRPALGELPSSPKELIHKLIVDIEMDSGHRGDHAALCRSFESYLDEYLGAD